MPSLGPAEILVILVVALLVFGPNKMPDVARQAGKAFREFRRVQQHLRSEISDVVSDFDVENASSVSAPEASDMATGGDPVPMLPPKDPAPADSSADPAGEPSPPPESQTAPPIGRTDPPPDRQSSPPPADAT